MLNAEHQLLEGAVKVLGAESLFHIEDIQSLWSGYGKIMRYGLVGGDRQTVIIKHVKLPDQANHHQANHPRGWNTGISHQRKIRSYHVESAWYRHWSKQCDASCRVPACFFLSEQDEEFLMVLEDLDASGFAVRKRSISIRQMQVCLSWLANFHATFIGQKPAGLWPTGTYWHLETRPDEWQVLEDMDLKESAGLIDEKLSHCRYLTLVHGDAKLANFCFSESGDDVAAVDFQYVGGGCGMKDVAYFIGSCLNEEECERYEAALLDFYFNSLVDALKHRGSTIDMNDLVNEWRALYPFAWTDFHRFIKGWSPGHWKIHSYSEKIARDVITQLKGG